MAKKETQGAGTATLVLALLKGGEMYGYQIIEELERRSNSVFQLKEGTLYPVLHGLERDRLVTAWDARSPSGRPRRYYRITARGLRALEEQARSWETYSRAVTAILQGA